MAWVIVDRKSEQSVIRKNSWLSDTGALFHMTNTIFEGMFNLKDINSDIKVGSGPTYWNKEGRKEKAFNLKDIDSNV